jgi:hypothetical protein
MKSSLKKAGKHKALAIGAALIGLLLLAGAKVARRSGTTRGFRNNNPGNIRLTKTLYPGEVPVSKNTDGAFKQFGTYTDGVRAMIYLVDYHYRVNQTDTITKLISKWAPSNENNTAAYIQKVAQRTGFGPDKKLTPNYLTMKKLVDAIIIQENGKQKLSDADFWDAWKKSENTRKIFKTT